ncbi:hypothetical protein NA57DRAFT_35795 [Rhizodiscina lignyota]|uniref:Uncharacterized protein n=1 Tax=Rhizodiscina lignyota TaxID=1504668 RepID=A0A9P4IKX5_9PEZI|nr:hypothetical protein NA57DRAFT_35795 [Rhizodiscina lignyota]
MQRHISRKGKTSTVDTISSVVSETTTRLRSASVKLMQTDPPLGMWAASSMAAARAPSIGEVRRGYFGEQGWGGEAAETRRRASGHERSRRWTGRRRSSAQSGSGSDGEGTGKRRRTVAAGAHGTEQFPKLEEEPTLESVATPEVVEMIPTRDFNAEDKIEKQRQAEGSKAEVKKSPTFVEAPLPSFLRRDTSGYIHHPKLPWTTSTGIALYAFWKWFLTPLGFLITIYGLNVVAWGGMLFLLLCNAAPAMCHPTCDDINSPRRIWLEVDSQILNALFCVTGFGLAPWRFRDLWWLMVYRLGIQGRSATQRQVGLRRLGGIHSGWFRLPGSDHLGPHVDIPMNGEEPIVVENPAIPIPASKTPPDPLTDVRAPPTKLWKMDFVIWCNVWNTFLQACLCGFMWGRNRYNRPSWATGLFIGLACVIAGLGGIMMFKEGKKVKRVEGVPVPEEQQKALLDLEMQVGWEKSKSTQKDKSSAEKTIGNGGAPEVLKPSSFN